MGIDLNKNIIYKHASLRFFNEGEHHVNRICEDDVLLLVFKGVLRFSENNAEKEISAGEYYIQKHGIKQTGERASNSPKYLYVHFRGEWSQSDFTLAEKGHFNYSLLKSEINELNDLSHKSAAYIEQTAKFYTILSELYVQTKDGSIAAGIKKYLCENFRDNVTLKDLSEVFHFSKNHIIHIFHDKYNMTPFEYLNKIRVQNAKKLLEISSDTAESIALESGFNDYSNFYRVFRKLNSVSPGEWRNICRKSTF